MLHSTRGLSHTSPRPNTSRETAWSLTQVGIKDRARGMGTKVPGITIHLNLRGEQGQLFYIQSRLLPRNRKLPPRTHSSLDFLNSRRKLEDRASLPLCLVPEHSPKDTELRALMTHQQSVLGCPGAAKLKRFFRGGQWPECTDPV